MDVNYTNTLALLLHTGWDVQLQTRPLPAPDEIRYRYKWLPNEVWGFIEETSAAVSPDGKAWIVTSADMASSNTEGFAWNQWELDTLAAAADDARWASSIRSFWDAHFPLILSVKSGYAYFAIEQHGLSVVHGEEPEYDQISQISSSIVEFLNQLTGRSSRLARWV